MNTSKNNTKQTENMIANTTTAVQEVDTLQTQSFKELLKNLMSKNKYVLDESIELSKVQEAIKISKIMSILHKETLLYTQMSLMNINNLDVSEFPYSNSIKTISKKTFVSYLKIVSDSNPICNELLCCMFNFMFHNIRDDDFINDFYNNDQVDISVVINNSSIKLSEIIKKVMDVKKLHYSEFETVCYMNLFTYFCQIFSAIKESNKFQKSLTLINYNKPEIGFKDLKYVDLSHHITNKFLIVQLIKSSLSLNNKVYFLKLLGCSRSSYFENNTAIKHLFCDLVCEYNDKVKNQLLTETLNKETSAAKKEILKKSFVNNVKHTECEFIDLVTGDDYLNTLNLTKEEKSLSFFQYDKIERYVKQLVADACVPIFYLI